MSGIWDVLAGAAFLLALICLWSVVVRGTTEYDELYAEIRDLHDEVNLLRADLIALHRMTHEEPRFWPPEVERIHWGPRPEVRNVEDYPPSDGDEEGQYGDPR